MTLFSTSQFALCYEGIVALYLIGGPTIVRWQFSVDTNTEYLRVPFSLLRALISWEFCVVNIPWLGIGLKLSYFIYIDNYV